MNYLYEIIMLMFNKHYALMLIKPVDVSMCLIHLSSLDIV